jgi:hypothetical protein
MAGRKGDSFLQERRGVRSVKASWSRRDIGLGFVVGLLSGALILLVGVVFIEAPIGEATVAAGTIALAAATVWLGIQTLEVSRRTGELGQITHEELDLVRDQAAVLREQAAAMKETAATQRDQLLELRETRFASFMPMLRWQSPRCFVFQDDNAVVPAGETFPQILAIDVLCTNEGPGPARVLRRDVSCDSGEKLFVEGMGIPSTIDSGVRLNPLRIRSEPLPSVSPGVRIVELTLRYGDLFGEFEYETRIELTATVRQDGCEADFITSDERSALERRTPRVRLRVLTPPNA